VIRFKNPNKKVIFEDIIRGEIEFDTTELGDFVIAKSLDDPLYHLTVVVDDFETGVTHIIRGEDGDFKYTTTNFNSRSYWSSATSICPYAFKFSS